MERRVTWPLGHIDEFPEARISRVRILVGAMLRGDRRLGRGPRLLRGILVEDLEGVLYLDAVIRCNDQWDLARKLRENVREPVERLLGRRIGEPQVGRYPPDLSSWPLEEEAGDQPGSEG